MSTPFIVVGKSTQSDTIFGYKSYRVTKNPFGSSISEVIEGINLDYFIVDSSDDSVKLAFEGGDSVLSDSFTIILESTQSVILTFSNGEYSGTNSDFADAVINHISGVCNYVVSGEVEVTPSGFADQTISNETSSGFKINWVAPTGGDAVDNYIVDVDEAGTPISGSPFTMAGSTLSKTVSGLNASTSYNTKVTAVNEGGSVSTNAVVATTTA